MNITKTLLKRPAETQERTFELRQTFSRLFLNRKGLAILSGVAIMIALASGMLLGKKKSVAQNIRTPVLTVTTQPASMKSIDSVLAVHGSIAPWDPISIGSTTSGLEVMSVLVEEGTLVKKGQALVTLDSSQLEAQIESEKARLAGSIATVSKSIQPNRPEDINALAAAVSQAQANVEDQQAALLQAQANLANALSNRKRYQYLKTEGAVSEQEAESRETTAQVNEAAVRSAEKRMQAVEFALKQAQERFSMAKIGGRKEDIQIAHANVTEIKGNVKRLQRQIDQTIIKAPVDGLITQRDVHIGDIASAGKIMFLMTRDNRLELRAQVPETDLHLIKPGQTVMVDSSFSGKGKVEGRVREISPLVDSDSRLATVRIDVSNNCGLKAGMYAEGHINISRYIALTVPSRALISRDGDNNVFVLHKDQVESRHITVGNRDHDLVQISSGLSVNEPIVIDGAGFLKDGDFVSVSN